MYARTLTYTHICACMHRYPSTTHKHMYLNSCTHTCLHTQARNYVYRIHMHTLCTHIPVPKGPQRSTLTHTHTGIHMHTHTRIRVHTSKDAHAHTHTHTHTHTLAHRHTCELQPREAWHRHPWTVWAGRTGQMSATPPGWLFQRREGRRLIILQRIPGPR